MFNGLQRGLSMNDLGLKGKVAIVTGAGGGIGREIALALANEGVKILANDIGVSLSGEGGSIQPAEETCGLITQKGGKLYQTLIVLPHGHQHQKLLRML